MTSFPDVDAFAGEFGTRVEHALESNLVGIYLGGSLALGDYQPATSDIDAVVATIRPVDAAEIARLKAIHDEVELGPWKRKLEAGYFPLKALKRWDWRDSTYPYVSAVSPFAMCELLDRTLDHAVLRESGLIVFGPAPKTIIAPISPDQIREAARERLRSGDWGQGGSTPEWMRQRKYQAFTVLTMCRAMHTLRIGAVASKSASAKWAMAALDPRWHPLITWALGARGDSEPGDMTETLSFVRYAVVEERRSATISS